MLSNKSSFLIHFTIFAAVYLGDSRIKYARRWISPGSSLYLLFFFFYTHLLSVASSLSLSIWFRSDLNSRSMSSLFKCSQQGRLLWFLSFFRVSSFFLFVFYFVSIMDLFGLISFISHFTLVFVGPSYFSPNSNLSTSRWI